MWCTILTCTPRMQCCMQLSIAGPYSVQNHFGLHCSVIHGTDYFCVGQCFLHWLYSLCGNLLSFIRKLCYTIFMTPVSGEIIHECYTYIVCSISIWLLSKSDHTCRGSRSVLGRVTLWSDNYKIAWSSWTSTFIADQPRMVTIWTV